MLLLSHFTNLSTIALYRHKVSSDKGVQALPTRRIANSTINSKQ
jgi:hypothetical protein